jgi:hypothetical protein
MPRFAFFLSALALAVAPVQAQTLPTEFVHDQIWLTPRVEGHELRFFTDTGGGWNAISKQTATELALASETVEADEGTATLVDYPRFDAGHAIPVSQHFMQGRLMVVDPDKFLHGGDGFLGGRWFADGIWDFDYPRQRLSRRETHVRAKSADAAVTLGFQTNARGERSTHFPSIAVEVDGETLDMLFDTGATATLTASSGPVFGLPAGTNIGTSFIEKEKFDRWRQRHPDWRVIEQADDKGGPLRRMIEVPAVVIAGHRVGPVWFAEQPPGAFQKYMASMMDRPTWGAIGGSALKYFRVVVDYPAAKAWFEPAAAH